MPRLENTKSGRAQLWAKLESRSSRAQARPKNARKRLLLPCRLWNGAKDDKGYGVLKCPKGTLGNKSGFVRVHRLAYFLSKGVLLANAEVDHECRDNKNCWEPTHLKLMGPSEHAKLSNDDKYRKDFLDSLNLEDL